VRPADLLRKQENRRYHFPAPWLAKVASLYALDVFSRRICWPEFSAAMAAVSARHGVLAKTGNRMLQHYGLRIKRLNHSVLYQCAIGIWRGNLS
jgi:hypothetical protein